MGAAPLEISKKKPLLGTPIGDQMSEKNYHWEVGVAAVGVEQYIFRTTVMVCVDGCDPMEFQKKPSLGTCMATRIFQKNYHWEVGLATIGVEQHTFLTTVFVCVWVGVVPSGLGGDGSSQATALQRELYERRRPRRRRLVASNRPPAGTGVNVLSICDQCFSICESMFFNMRSMFFNVFQYAVNVFQCFSICGQCFSICGTKPGLH
jgi:hypothetical protein